jgi:hypothetical protein
MKSKFFRTETIDTTAVEEDVRSLARVASEKLQAIGRFFAEAEHVIQTDDSMEREKDKLLRDDGITGEHFARARRLCRFLVQAADKCDDEPNALIDDMNTLTPLGDVRSLLIAVSGAVVRAVTSRRRDRMAARGIPALTAVSYTCDVRVDLPRFQPFYDDPATRAVEPRAWLPVVLMRFSTDEDAELVCQIDHETLQRAIRVLQAAEKDIGTVERNLRVAGLSPSDEAL